MSKIQKLQSTIWEKRPLILCTSAAYELTVHDHHFYMVTRLGEEPASFSRFEFADVVSGGYEIKITDEQDAPIKTLSSDEWVPVFQQ